MEPPAEQTTDNLEALPEVSPSPITEPKPVKKAKSKKLILVIVVLLLLVLASAGYWFFIKQDSNTPSNQVTPQTPSDSLLNKIDLEFVGSGESRVYFYSEAIHNVIPITTQKPLSYTANIRKKDASLVINYDQLRSELGQKLINDGFTAFTPTPEILKNNFGEAISIRYKKDSFVCTINVTESGRVINSDETPATSEVSPLEEFPGTIYQACADESQVAAKAAELKDFYETYQTAIGVSDEEFLGTVLELTVKDSPIDGYETAAGSVGNIKEMGGAGISFAREKGGHWIFVEVSQSIQTCATYENVIVQKSYPDTECLENDKSDDVTTVRKYYHL